MSPSIGFNKVLVLLFGLLFIHWADAQNCTIIFPEHTNTEIKERAYRDMAQTDTGLSSWTSLENGILQDGNYINLDLAPQEVSETLQLSDFRLNIPEGSEIHGLSLILKGKSDTGKPTDVSVQLVNSEHIGRDLANVVFAGTSWPAEDGEWRYGSSWYNWELNLTAELLNSPDFGLYLSVENNRSESISAQLDMITIQVKYTPPYTICLEHACIIGSIQNSPANTSYDWQIPTDFEVISDSENEDVIVISPIVTQPGLFELCATPQGSAMDPCCALFRMKDCRSADIGDYVWQDVNGNGIQDMEEIPLGGVLISLYDPLANLVAQTVSDENGFYQFLDVPTDEYYIQVGLPDGYVFSPADVSSDNLDSDISGILGIGTSDLFMVFPAQDITNLDIGVVPLYEITGTLWEDMDADGVRAVGEPLINGILLYLIDALNNVVATTETDSQGVYQFEGLLQGDYTISVNLPGKTFVSPQDVGNDAFDSDFNLFGNLDVFALSQNMVFDLGMYRKARIGDFIWLDYNRDGQFDSGDNGLGDIVVRLLDLNGNVMDTQITESGNYNFIDIVPGDYRLDISVGPDYIHTLLSSINAPLNFNGSTYTTTVTLISGEMDLDLDFGFQYAPSSISGYAWLDNDGDGFSTGESTISDIQVDLFMASGQFVASTVTDSDGKYIFDTLNPGSYYVVFTQPSGLVSTVLNGDSTVENDIVDGATDIIWLQANTDITDINAGYFAYSTIGDFIWLDINRNGLQDLDESGIPNLSLKLIDLNTNLFFFGSTDADGYYSFSFLSPGNYSLSISDTDDIQATTADAGNGSNDSRPINEYTGDDVSEVIVINSGTTIDNLDFGYQYKPSSISGYTWIDLNADGVDNSEEKLAGVDVGLWTLGGAFVSATSTGTDGTYSFNDLNPGAYYLTFTAEQDYQYTSFGADSDVDQVIAAGSTTQIIIAADQDINGIDVGFFKYASVGDYIWIDADKNGIQDATEEILSEITVTLLNATTGASSAMTTDLNGRYLFTDLVPGAYILQIGKTATLVPTQVDAGNGFNDSRALTDVGNVYTSEVFELVSDLDDRSRDFGFQYLPSSISGSTWVDLNADGNFDNAEPFKEGTQVRLNDGLGNFIASTVTDADGYYIFNDLLPGDYYILFEQGAFQYSPPTTDNSIVNSMFGSTDLIMLSADQNLLDINGAFYQYASVGDYVWIDTDNDGIQDASEEGLSQAIITLQNLTTNISVTQLTDQDGAYLFTDLLPGDYRISIEKNPLYAPTTSESGNGMNDSRDLIDSGSVYTGGDFNLISDQNEGNQDYGFKFLFASISGFTWFDYNADGSFDLGEPIKAGTVVNLLDANNVNVATTTTDNSGNYLFDDLVPGEYYISFGPEPNLLFSPVGLDNAVTGILGVGSTAKIILAPDQNLTNINAGYFAYASVGDFIWIDTDNDGIQDAGEGGLSQATITLQNLTTNISVTQLTDQDGAYLFTDLLPGDYRISIEKNPLYAPTISESGNGMNDSRDLIDSGSVYTGGNFNLISDQNEGNQDYGFKFLSASISGFTWFDYNADGSFDLGEPIKAGTVVNLLDANNVNVATTTTDNDGNYLFDDLVPGEYYISFELEPNLLFSPVGLDNAVTGIFGVGSTEKITLSPDQSVTDVNAGYFGYSSIGDYLWLDSNADGIQDNTESGIADVTVSLFDENATLVDQIMTDDDGHYTFVNLLPADYYLVFNYDSNLNSTNANAGNGQNDSDIIDVFGPGSTGIFSLGFLQDITDIDGGVINIEGSISGVVFIDGDANGINEMMDMPYPGVEVELYSSIGVLIAQTSTAMDGSYDFPQVTPGNYYIQFLVPSDFVITAADQGVSNMIDSDVTGTNGVGTTDVFNLPVMGAISNLDMGVYQYATIGDMVWIDVDDNAVFSNSEDGLENVVISLINQNGSVIDMKTTGADGLYCFTDVVPGVYQVRFEMPSNYSFVTPDVGMNESIDSDANNASGNLGFTNPFMIASGVSMKDIDAGVVFSGLGVISGLAWEDLNGDGIQQNLEPLEEGVIVELYNEQNLLLNSVITAADGFYQFTSVPLGNVYLVFSTDVDEIITTADVGMDDLMDSDVTGSVVDQSTDLIAITTNSTIQNVNVGIYRYASLGDRVWLDANENGLLDMGEEGVNGVNIELFDMNGTLISTTTSMSVNGVDGNYMFSNIMPGDYRVSFSLGGNLVFTQAFVGNDPSIDSDVDANGTAIGTTPALSLSSAEINNDIDAGVTELGDLNLSGFVFTDQKGNGVKDISDTYENGITVNLYSEASVLVDTAVTATDVNGNAGFYSFDNVPIGTYYLEFVLPNDAEATDPDQGTNDGLDSDVTGANGPGTTDLIDLASTSATNQICAGFFYRGYIGNFIWNDEIPNGIQDPSEIGLTDIMVSLFDESGNGVDATFSAYDMNGNPGFYTFFNLKPGNYYVTFNNSPGIAFVDADQGSNDDLDSDVTNAFGFGTTDLICVTSGALIDNVDAGMQLETAEIGDYVWTDLNGNGVQNAGEPGLEGVRVDLYDEFDNYIKSEFSNAQGEYLFEDVQPGNYYLIFVAPTQYTVSEAYQGGDDTNDSDIMNVIAPGATNIFNLSPGEADMDIDAGFYIPSRIGDFVWDDLNKNGIQDAGEPGMENIEVNLRIGTSFILQNTVTDANGFYQFDGLKQGTYSVIFSNLPSGYVFSPMDATANDMLDSDANPSNGETSLIVLSHGVDFMELDAGVYKNNLSNFDRFEMRYWPQPTQRYVTHEIVSPFVSPVKWTISTMNGQVVASGTEDDIVRGKNEFTIDLNDISAGKYVIRYDFKGFYKTQSIIKF